MNGLMNKILTRLRVDPIGVAMPGPRLPQRIHGIIEARSSTRISRKRVALLVAACAAICLTFIVVTLSKAQATQMPGAKMSFEVASVKQDKDGHPYSNFPLGPGNSYSANGGLLSANDIPVSVYIGFAYGLTTYQRYALDTQLPKWAKDERFDIQARANTNATKDQMRMMMQSLLATRFKFAAHTETHEGPIFALVLAKPGEVGPQLHLRSSDSPPCGAFTLSPSARSADGSPMACDVFLSLVDTGHIKTSARNVTLQMIAGAFPLAGMPALDRPVVDESGLTGNYDFSIDCARESTTAPDAKSAEPGPTFLEALQDQLGLKLVSKTGEVNTLVIDHIEQPTPN
ncbi:MAG: TIGR03435 family protein [Candidatus Acidiferrales bacterium]